MSRSRWALAGIAVAMVASAIVWRAVAEDTERGQYAGDVMLLDGVVPAPAGVTLPPGTPIGAGLEVAEGSYLLGGALPYLYSTMHGVDPIEDDGFEAYLLVTEPIRDVVDRYRAQAVAAGFAMSPVWCVEGNGALSCRTQCQESCALGTATGWDHGRRLSIDGDQGQPGEGQPPLSDLRIDYRLIGDPPFPTQETVEPPWRTTERGSLPADWPALPAVGSPIYSFNDFEVATGTVLLAQGLGATNGSGETTAVFEVVDDVDTVIDRFLAQPKFLEENPGRETFQRDGQRVDLVYWSDGRSQSLEFHDLADGPTVLVLTSYVAD